MGCAGLGRQKGAGLWLGESWRPAPTCPNGPQHRYLHTYRDMAGVQQYISSLYFWNLWVIFNFRDFTVFISAGASLLGWIQWFGLAQLATGKGRRLGFGARVN